ncbi:MAG: hypothetical protein DHS20C11_12760 [Lysobacteraceae bacterium]|nr:MAG: hypothetical protein DHS20C11_12760 [Xanthomonadaceae bacterium]
MSTNPPKSDGDTDAQHAIDNHRAYVGNERDYDFLGASQFRLLCALGLRENHRLLDLGCGSLRAGRLFIAYLRPGHYYGIEPNPWLIDSAIEEEVSSGLVELKQPTFAHNSDFAVDGFGVEFDFILAQSIFSHTEIDLTRTALSNFRKSLKPGGRCLMTFAVGNATFPGTDWVYPKTVSYPRALIRQLASECDLDVVELDWFHPRQRWFLMVAKGDRLPTATELDMLSGVVLYDRKLSVSASAMGRRARSISLYYKYSILPRLRRVQGWLRGRKHRGHV